MQSNIPGLAPLTRGKVRDIYDNGDQLVLITTDRLSAFDWVLQNGIPNKGNVLNRLSLFWFNFLKVPNHFISANLADMPSIFSAHPELEGRTMLVRKVNVFPVECVVRGYLSGSAWKEYKQSGMVCGIQLPPGLKESERLAEPIFTPATKEATGHDINISFERMAEIVGLENAQELRQRSIDIYNQGAAHAFTRGIIIADTKFEFGYIGDQIYLIDEVMTPDSSRFWPLDRFSPGRGQPSFDKQFVRDWLEASGWDKNSPPPELPMDIIDQTSLKYVEAYELLTGEAFQ